MVILFAVVVCSLCCIVIADCCTCIESVINAYKDEETRNDQPLAPTNIPMETQALERSAAIMPPTQNDYFHGHSDRRTRRRSYGQHYPVHYHVQFDLQLQCNGSEVVIENASGNRPRLTTQTDVFATIFALTGDSAASETDSTDSSQSCENDSVADSSANQVNEPEVRTAQALVNNSPACAVCLVSLFQEGMSTCVIVPCYHTGVCLACAEQIWCFEEEPKCPMCRQDITRVRKTFGS